MAKIKLDKSITLVVLCIAVAGAVFIYYTNSVASLSKEIRSKKKALDKFSPAQRALFTKGALSRLEGKLHELQEKAKTLRPMYDSSKTGYVEQTDSQNLTALYFKQKLYSVDQDLKRQAFAKDISLPQTLGFGEELPSDEMVWRSLMQLAQIEELVGMLLERKVHSVNLIKVPDVLERMDREKSKVLHVEIPIYVRFSCDTKCLVDVLDALGRISPVYSLRRLKTKKVRKDILEVELIASRFVER